MNEKERNKRLIVLILKLQSQNDFNSLELLKSFCDNDTVSIKKTFELLTNKNA